ncbi:MAG: hypothetical protein D6728_17540 [Cyanobacteria bacterium J055]|nr:MAG: hypothetical protein D6728_17540 [Cyanobacteria bacterium J055]
MAEGGFLGKKIELLRQTIFPHPTGLMMERSELPGWGNVEFPKGKGSCYRISLPCPIVGNFRSEQKRAISL